MKRQCFMFKIKEKHKEEYKKHHKNVWPEMLEVIRKSGRENYSIFMTPEGLLFGYFETSDNLFNLSSGTGTTPTLGSIVQNGKFAAWALLEFVRALKSVDLPTLGKPTIPHLKLIIYYLQC